MADETPSLHIDTDWKKQAQEEKRKLAEQEKAKAEQAKATLTPAFSTGSTISDAPASASAKSRPARGQPGQRELPPPSFAALTQSIVTQILFYLGDLAPRGSEPQINLDMAKHQIDILGILEEKTNGNLSDDEKHLLDAALYETRMRYVNVSAQYVT